MAGPVLSSTVAQANEFLGSLYSGARTRGEAYLRGARIRWHEQKSPAEISATLTGNEPGLVRVTFNFDAAAGWSAQCSCTEKTDCRHIYAAMKGLIGDRGATWAATPPKPDRDTLTPLGQFLTDVAEGVGRSLKPEEKKFLEKLDRLHASCLKGHLISQWDFNQFGMRLGGASWEPMKLWPSVPTTLREFWLHLAFAAKEKNVALPEFMQPVTDFSQISPRLRKWRRNEEINRWQKNLDAINSIHAARSFAGGMRCELRIRFGEKVAALEVKRPGREHFEQLRAREGREFRNSINEGAVELSTAGEWLWRACGRHVETGKGYELAYRDSLIMADLSRMFRTAGFEDLLVNPDGKPFARPDTALTWKLDSTEDANGDYTLRVAFPDGSPLPPLLCVLEGRPMMFVTRDAVYRGPIRHSEVIDASCPNVIPAAALESRTGAILLNALGLELPPRLRERVKTVPLQMVVSCILKAAPSGKGEMCVVRITANAPDNEVVDVWNGSAWTQASEQPVSPAGKEESIITFYDRTGLRPGTSLLNNIDLKWDRMSSEWTIKVTRSFPEQFAAWLRGLPTDVKVNLDGELVSFQQSPIAGSIRLEAKESGIDWFDLKVVLNIKDTQLTDQEVKLLLNAKGGFVRLKDGKGWRRLKFDIPAEDDERLARLGLNPRELTAEPQRLHALQLADEAASKFLSEKQFAAIQNRVREIKTRVTPPVPDTVRATLRPYQTDGFHFLAYLTENGFGGILADDMGLGKTLQTLTWLAWLRTRTDAKGQPMPMSQCASLVVCPKSVMDNWRAECERFTPHLHVKVWASGELHELPKRIREADLHIINYNQFRLLNEALYPVRWLALILDEGQYIKNPSSQTAILARVLSAQHRLVLSGTPIENRLLDLWSLMAFAMPGMLGSRMQFTQFYDTAQDPLARRRLSARVRPFLLRRTKNQVAKDLPDRIEEDLFCEMEGEQEMLYRAELKRAQQMLLRITTPQQLNADRFHVLTSLLRLRQISCHPRLVKADSTATSAKMEALVEQLEPLVQEGHKVLVFSQFVEMLDILQEHLKTLTWPTFYLAGSTENRGELVQRFQSTPGAGVFLISLKAGGFGLNLTAASYVVLFDPWWNPAVENQAIDRTHRIGQSRNVIAYRLLIKGSIEEKIRQLQKKKSELADDVLGEERFSQSLTLDELQYLFSDETALPSSPQ